MRAYNGVLASSPQPLASAIAAIARRALFPSSTSSPLGEADRISSVYLPPRYPPPVLEDRALLDGVGVLRVKEQQAAFGIVLDSIDRGLHKHHLAHIQDSPAQFQDRGIGGGE